MMVSDKRYQEHQVFCELDRYVAFYQRLAHSVFAWVSQGTGAIANIDSYLFSSIQGTLASIQTILRDGRINDAYALLRKYHDSAIINIYSNLYLDDHFGINNFVVAQINDWLQGTSQIPEYRIMSQYIRSSAKVARVTAAIFDTDDRYKRIRSRCNDHTHYNFYRNVLLNDNKLHLPNRGRALDVFSADLRDLFILHLAYMLCAREHYMMSSDYRDALECNMTPEPDSEYWVASFAQEMFDYTVAKHRPDIAAIIKVQASMHLA